MKTRVGLFGPALLQAMQTCDFEGEVTWALAVNGKKAFAVTTLRTPTRLVIDFASRP